MEFTIINAKLKDYIDSIIHLNFDSDHNSFKKSWWFELSIDEEGGVDGHFFLYFLVDEFYFEGTWYFDGESIKIDDLQTKTCSIDGFRNFDNDFEKGDFDYRILKLLGIKSISIKLN